LALIIHNLYISPEAQNDLQDIKAYITEQLDNPQAALRIVTQSSTQIRQLTQFPKIGRPLSAIMHIETSYRFLVCGNYLVFYRHEQTCVFVDRILYGKRDYMKILFPEQPAGHAEH
jgi:addiction module RelE/StbE family toxin